MKSLTPEPSKSVSAPFLKEHFQTALFETFSQDRQHRYQASMRLVLYGGRLEYGGL